jgi:Tol biopolymer transport system component
MTLPHDRQIAAWLAGAGPDEGPPESLARALAATRRTRKRPRWTFPERWLPVQLTMARAQSQRPLLVIVALALLLMALVASALYLGSQRRQPTPLFRNGAVVYSQDGDLFIADQIGSTPRPLVVGPDADAEPVFSNQGDRVAFVRAGQTAVKVMTIRPDGAELTELVTLSGGMDRLVWSPDDRALLAIRGMAREPEWYQTDVIASDGSGSRTLVPGVHVIWAVWRPDGRQILFNGVLDGADHEGDKAQRVYIADADGSNIRELPIAPYFGLLPAWSPDGKRISFVSGDPERDLGITIADINEAGTVTGSRELTFDPDSSVEALPVWSPDGTMLAFRISKDDEWSVGVADADGSNFRIVAPDGPAPGDTFMWSPDGRSLLFDEKPVVDDLGNVGPPGAVWSVDVATGQRTEVGTPVESWQRLAP